MEMNLYQLRAMETDRLQIRQTTAEVLPSGPEIIVPLLGLSGEVGELLSEYKKYLRDGDCHKLSKDRIGEELGDILWYLTNVATKFDLDLHDIAKQNLEKIEARWGATVGQQSTPSTNRFFDDDFPESERLPRQFNVSVRDEGNGIVRAFYGNTQLGHGLTDNRYTDDGYRFHDIFHFAYAAVLRWSPVTRWMFKRKRKSSGEVDEVEDGGRAIAIEEGISAMVFSYAEQRQFLSGTRWVDSELLRTIKGMTNHLEVSQCTVGEWESAILSGFEAWREVRRLGSGELLIDLDRQSLEVLPAVKEDHHANLSRQPVN